MRLCLRCLRRNSSKFEWRSVFFFFLYLLQLRLTMKFSETLQWTNDVNNSFIKFLFCSVKMLLKLFNNFKLIKIIHSLMNVPQNVTCQNDVAMYKFIEIFVRRWVTTNNDILCINNSFLLEPGWIIVQNNAWYNKQNKLFCN